MVFQMWLGILAILAQIIGLTHETRKPVSNYRRYAAVITECPFMYAQLRFLLLSHSPCAHVFFEAFGQKIVELPNHQILDGALRDLLFPVLGYDDSALKHLLVGELLATLATGGGTQAIGIKMLHQDV